MIETLSAEDALSALPAVLADRISRFGECLLWRDKLHPQNGGLQVYGRVSIDGRQAYAHRAVWSELNDREPRRLRPVCDRPDCVYHWVESTPGPRAIRKAIEVQYLQDFIEYCQFRVKELTKRRPTLAG